MGRPLNKTYLGNPEKGGYQLGLSYVWLEGSEEAEEGFWISRQVGTGRYEVTNGERKGVVKLVDVLPTNPGEGVIVVKQFEGSYYEYAKKIHNRTVVTFDGNVYKWSVDPATNEAEADFILDGWENPLEAEPESDEYTLTAEGFEGGVGYYDDIGSISGQFIEGFTVIGFYEDNISRLYIQGDHNEISNIKITIGGVTIQYDFYGSEGNSEFLSEDSFGFEDGETYTITNVVVTLAP